MWRSRSVYQIGPVAMAGRTPTTEESLRALGAVISSSTFASTPRLQQLLKYIAEEAIAGRAASLKAFAIAVDVFGRDETFDPANDTIVRVQAGRLREQLTAYYAGEGKDEPIEISLPKGTYVPEFACRKSKPDPISAVSAEAAKVPAPQQLANSASVRPHWLVIAAAVLAALVIGWFGANRFRHAPPGTGADDQSLAGAAYPIIEVAPFVNATGKTEYDFMQRGLQRQIGVDLQRFRTIRVSLPAESQRVAKNARGFVVSGDIIAQGDGLLLGIKLTNRETGSTVMERHLSAASKVGDYFDILSSLSAEVSGQVAGPAGLLAREEKLRIASRYETPVFRCIVLFDDMTRNKTVENFRRAHDCVSSVSKKYHSDGSLKAALAWMTLLSSPESDYEHLKPLIENATCQAALEIAEDAVAADPGNARTHQYLGMILRMTGDLRAATDSLQRAYSLNPNNPDVVMDLAALLSLRGDWNEAAKLSDLALTRHPDPPGWYYLTRYFQALVHGRPNDALVATAFISQAADPNYPIYQLAAASMANRRDDIEAMKPRVLDLARVNGGDALRGVRMWLPSKEILEALARELRKYDIPIDEAALAAVK